MGTSSRQATRSRLGVVVLSLALVALVTPTAGVVVDGHFAASLGNHGHIGSPAAIAHHTHAYGSSPDAGRTDGVVFIPSDDGSVASAVTLAYPVGELTVTAGIYRADLIDDTTAPAGSQPEVPVPPPRT